MRQVKTTRAYQHVPMIITTDVEKMDSISRYVELGVEDYLFKPFKAELLLARVAACMAQKRLRDAERAFLKQLRAEQEKSEALLHNILPKPIADRLKDEHATIAESFPDVTVLFARIADFSSYSSRASPEEVVSLLAEIFSAFDRLADQFGVEKIKTIGEAYMAAGGVPIPQEDHTEVVADMALAMQKEIARFDSGAGEPFSLRIGIHTGPVVAGVLYTSKLSYDLWGETVNVADQMESYGLPGRIQVSASTYERLKNGYVFEERGTFYVTGTGEVEIYLLEGRRAPNA